jgi:hypothetical protein
VFRWQVEQLVARGEIPPVYTAVRDREVYDPDLEKQIRLVQQKANLKVDGIVGPRTWQFLTGQQLVAVATSSPVSSGGAAGPATPAATSGMGGLGLLLLAGAGLGAWFLFGSGKKKARQFAGWIDSVTASGQEVRRGPPAPRIFDESIDDWRREVREQISRVNPPELGETDADRREISLANDKAFSRMVARRRHQRTGFGDAVTDDLLKKPADLAINGDCASATRQLRRVQSLARSAREQKILRDSVTVVQRRCTHELMTMVGQDAEDAQIISEDLSVKSPTFNPAVRKRSRKTTPLTRNKTDPDVDTEDSLMFHRRGPSDLKHVMSVKRGGKTFYKTRDGKWFKRTGSQGKVEWLRRPLGGAWTT